MHCQINCLILECSSVHNGLPISAWTLPPGALFIASLTQKSPYQSQKSFKAYQILSLIRSQTNLGQNFAINQKPKNVLLITYSEYYSAQIYQKTRASTGMIHILKFIVSKWCFKHFYHSKGSKIEHYEMNCIVFFGFIGLCFVEIQYESKLLL